MPMRTCSGSPRTRCLADRGGNGEAGPHGAFGIGLAGLRPAEIDQHAIADVARDEAVKLLDRGGDARLIGADNLPQILGIEPRRECGRADEIAEHHAERAAFGRGLGRTGRSTGLAMGRRDRTGSSAGLSSRRNAAIASSKLAAMAERGDAEILEVVGRQIGQQFGVDVILAECRLVSFKTERSQPVRDVHCRSPPRAAAKSMALSASICPAATPHHRPSGPAFRA